MPFRTPSYRLLKSSGQAVVTIDGRDHYLGKHGSPELDWCTFWGRLGGRLSS